MDLEQKNHQAEVAEQRMENDYEIGGKGKKKTEEKKYVIIVFD